MTKLLLWKQKVKEFYGEHDFWLTPLFKFLLAFVVFSQINGLLGFMRQIDNIFVVLILSLICAMFSINVMTILACLLILGHCYAVGIETAGFAAVLLVLLMILFLRFTSEDNVALILTPISFTLHIPAAVPVGCGILRGASSTVPSGCGVILYFFMKLVKDRATVLQGNETEPLQKLQLLLDGVLKNEEMWLTVVVFAAVVVIVSVISRASFDYAWRIAIVTGAVVYIVIMVFGSMFMSVSTELVGIILSGVVAIIIGFVVEFFELGVDYSRIELTQFEDDEYIYYVKAVPKALISESKKSVKKFTPNSKVVEEVKLDEVRQNKETKAYQQENQYQEIKPIQEVNPGQTEKTHTQDFSAKQNTVQEEPEAVPVERVAEEDFDFEKQLEESLKNL